MVTIKSKKEIEYMKEACRVVAIMYEELEKKIKPGMSTWEVDQLAEKIRKRISIRNERSATIPSINMYIYK